MGIYGVLNVWMYVIWVGGGGGGGGGGVEKVL